MARNYYDLFDWIKEQQYDLSEIEDKTINELFDMMEELEEEPEEVNEVENKYEEAFEAVKNKEEINFFDFYEDERAEDLQDFYSSLQYSGFEFYAPINVEKYGDKAIEREIKRAAAFIRIDTLRYQDDYLEEASEVDFEEAKAEIVLGIFKAFDFIEEYFDRDMFQKGDMHFRPEIDKKEWNSWDVMISFKGYEGDFCGGWRINLIPLEFEIFHILRTKNAEPTATGEIDFYHSDKFMKKAYETGVINSYCFDEEAGVLDFFFDNMYGQFTLYADPNEDKTSWYIIYLGWEAEDEDAWWDLYDSYTELRERQFDMGNDLEDSQELWDKIDKVISEFISKNDLEESDRETIEDILEEKLHCKGL